MTRPIPVRLKKYRQELATIYRDSPEVYEAILDLSCRMSFADAVKVAKARVTDKEVQSGIVLSAPALDLLDVARRFR